MSRDGAAGGTAAELVGNDTGRAAGRQAKCSIPDLRPSLHMLTDGELAEEIQIVATERRAYVEIPPRWTALYADCQEYRRWWASGLKILDPIVERLMAEQRRRQERRPTGPKMTTDELAERFPERLRPVGNGRYKGMCPWHDDRQPSLVVYSDGYAHCFACGAHRPVADLDAAWRKVAA